MTLTFAVIDLDYFKKYNDNYGHPAGDSVLIKVAQVFKQSMRRPNDYTFRLGGEEFGIIFSGLNIKQSFEILEIIRNKIEKLNIEHCESDVSQFMTISLGAYLSSGPNIPDSNQLYIKADEALYVAKSQRNCVVVN
jgi:diguanylate cyclase (GGDEF)-like protein